MTRLKKIKARVEGARVKKDIGRTDPGYVAAVLEDDQWSPGTAAMFAHAPADLAWLVGWVESAAFMLTTEAELECRDYGRGICGNDCGRCRSCQARALLAQLEGDDDESKLG